MAIAPRNSGITREDVFEWLEEYEKKKKKDRLKIRTFLRRKLAVEGHDDTRIITRGMSNRAPTTTLIDLIIDDLSSYGFDGI
jgi:hypothetical protein